MFTKDSKNLDKERILDKLGLQEKSTLSSVLSLIGIGALAGAVLALLLTPKTGSELRQTMGRTFKRTAGDVATKARAKVGEVQAERGM